MFLPIEGKSLFIEFGVMVGLVEIFGVGELIASATGFVVSVTVNYILSITVTQIHQFMSRRYRFNDILNLFMHFRDMKLSFHVTE